MSTHHSQAPFLTARTRHPRSTLFPYTTLFRSTCERKARLTARSGMQTSNQLCPSRASRDQPVVWQRPSLQKVTTPSGSRSEEHTSELQSPVQLVCRLLLEKKKPGP